MIWAGWAKIHLYQAFGSHRVGGFAFEVGATTSGKRRALPLIVTAARG